MFPTFGPDTGRSAFDPTLVTIALGIVPQNLNIGNTLGTGVDFNAGFGKCWPRCKPARGRAPSPPSTARFSSPPTARVSRVAALLQRLVRLGLAPSRLRTG
jgi:hypothetical protein